MGSVGGFVLAFMTLPSDDVIPPLAQIHLLGRGTNPLSFWSGKLACGDALSAVLGRLLFKSRLRFLPLHTATVVRRVGSPHKRRTGVYISSCAACGRSAGSACFAAGLLEPYTTPPTLASRRVRIAMALLIPQALAPRTQ